MAQTTPAYQIASITPIAPVELRARAQTVYVNGKEVVASITMALAINGETCYAIVQDEDYNLYLIDTELFERARDAADLVPLPGSAAATEPARWASLPVERNEPTPPPLADPEDDQNIYVCKLRADRFFWFAGSYTDLVDLTGASGYAVSRKNAIEDATIARPRAQARFLNHSRTSNRGDAYARRYRQRLAAADTPSA